MCNFVSWIEITDENGEKQYLCLTDKHVFSKYGKERLQGFRDNDVLGHGAVRQYYADPNGNPLKRGKDCEVNDFWNTEKLPKEIADKILQFDKHWGKMFEKFFPNNSLVDIIRYAPDAWQEKACEQLLKQEPSNGDLVNIICHAPEAWQEKAQQILTQRKSI